MKAAVMPLEGARKSVPDERKEQATVRKRPSHILLGWRNLEAPLIAQVLAAMPERPALAPAEAAQRYQPLAKPASRHELTQA